MIGTFVRVRETTTHDWLGHGDHTRKHWSAGMVGEVVRTSRTDSSIRVKFDRSVYDIPREVSGCFWLHPDEVEPVSEEEARALGLGNCFKQWEEAAA